MPLPERPRAVDGRAPDVFRRDGWVPMRTYPDADEVDFAIVGTGAGGGTLACRLAEAGFSVVALDAGPYFRPLEEFASDESEQHKLYWTDDRITGGDNPISFGSNNSGKAVGGSTVHFQMVSLRMRPDWFKARSKLGYGADWPVSWREMWHYYDEVEDALKIAGPDSYPWGPPRGAYPYRAHEMNAAADVLAQACEAMGVAWAPTPIATLSAPRGLAHPCVYRGFCKIGCSTNAKQSALVTWIPRAIAAGAEIRDMAMVGRVEMDRGGRATGVLYHRDGEWRRQRARNVVVAGYAIETPRLLLMSANEQFPDGLANSSGLVGKYLMPNSNHGVYGLMDDEIRWYKSPPSLGVCEHWNYDDNKDFPGGYSFMSQGPLPGEWANSMATGRGFWGMKLRQEMTKYNRQAGLKIVGEVLPQELEPRRTDGRGRPVRPVHSQGDLQLCRGGQAPDRALDPLHDRRAAGDRGARRLLRQLDRASDGHLPDGRRSAHQRRRPRWPQLGHPEPVGLRRLAVPDQHGREPLADDPGDGMQDRRPDQGSRGTRRALTPRGRRGPGKPRRIMRGGPPERVWPTRTPMPPRPDGLAFEIVESDSAAARRRLIRRRVARRPQAPCRGPRPDRSPAAGRAGRARASTSAGSPRNSSRRRRAGACGPRR